VIIEPVGMPRAKERRTLTHSSFGALVLALLVLAPRAHALQPLQAFVESAKRKNPDNREAAAIVQQREAQRGVATAAYLPAFSAQGSYTRNQFEAAFAVAETGQTIVIQPLNGFDSYFTLQVPLVNVGAWEQKSAASATTDAARASARSTDLSVEASVTQIYYQLLGTEAVLFAAKSSLDVAQSNAQLVKDRHELGTASELDLQRSIADMARAQQDVATADRAVVSSRLTLESLSRLTPEAAAFDNYVPDDLKEETPLETWLGQSASDLVSVKPAILATEVASRSRSAARAQWIPTLGAQGQEHLTNAGGFTGRHAVYTLTATLAWRLDFALAPNVSAQTAALAAAQAREDKARTAGTENIAQAWHQIRAGIEQARAARAGVEAATAALVSARDRYANGVATQLEVVQAQRDVFSAQVSHAQAAYNLKYARAALRLASRRTTGEQ
jgi:outer membrane protein TolC